MNRWFFVLCLFIDMVYVFEKVCLGSFLIYLIIRFYLMIWDWKNENNKILVNKKMLMKLVYIFVFFININCII